MSDLISKLNKRIEIQEKVKVEDNSGGFSEEWALFKRVWAAIKNVDAFENFVADRLQNSLTHTITVRYTASINVNQRIKYKDRIFAIKGIVNPMERNRTLELKVEEIVL